MIALPSNESSSVEKKLLVCCARTRVKPLITEQIRGLLGSPVDWDALLKEAAHHSVTPLVCRQLPCVAADLIDAATLQRLKSMIRGFAIRNLLLSAELVTVMNHLQSAGIQATPYKGPVLAAQAYGDLALREFEDLDIILRQKDMTRANEVMIGLGYRPKFPWLLSGKAASSVAPGEYDYRDENRHMMVELHTERTLRHFPLPPDIDGLAKRLVTVSMGGQDVQTFSPEDTLLLLCIHGSKHFWEQLSWIADIAEFVQAQPLDWREVLVRAQSMRASRMLSVGLALAVQLLDAPLPQDILARVQCDPIANSIASKIESRLLAQSPSEPGVMARFHLRRQMLEGEIEGWRYSLRLATLPSDDDWSATRLPTFLAPLQVALRPLRLLRKYGLSQDTSPEGPVASKKAPN